MSKEAKTLILSPEETNIARRMNRIINLINKLPTSGLYESVVADFRSYFLDSDDPNKSCKIDVGFKASKKSEILIIADPEAVNNKYLLTKLYDEEQGEQKKQKIVLNNLEFKKFRIMPISRDNGNIVSQVFLIGQIGQDENERTIGITVGDIRFIIPSKVALKAPAAAA